MKTNWQIKKLGEVCDILDNFRKPVTARDRKAGDFPYYGATGIQDYVDSYIFDEDLVLVGEDGARWDAGDNTAFAISGKTWVNNHAHVIRPHRDILLDQWLIYFLNISDLSEYITGTTVKKLNQEKLKSIPIPLPPLEDQKKIVTILDEKFAKLREAKRLREEVIVDTEKILSAILREIFEEGKEKSWYEKKIGEIFIFNYGKGLSKDERSPDGEYSVYGANGELGKSDKFLVEGEGIIIGRKGSAGEIAKVTGKYWPTDVTYFVVESNSYNIDFAFYLFKYLDFTQYAKGVKPGINRNEIYDLSFYFPPLAEQKEIVTRLDTLSEKLHTLRELQKSQLEDMKKLEKAYLKEAFNGELL